MPALFCIWNVDCIGIVEMCKTTCVCPSTRGSRLATRSPLLATPLNFSFPNAIFSAEQTCELWNLLKPQTLSRLMQALSRKHQVILKKSAVTSVFPGHPQQRFNLVAAVATVTSTRKDMGAGVSCSEGLSLPVPGRRACFCKMLFCAGLAPQKGRNPLVSLFATGRALFSFAPAKQVLSAESWGEESPDSF